VGIYMSGLRDIQDPKGPFGPFLARVLGREHAETRVLLVRKGSQKGPKGSKYTVLDPFYGLFWSIRCLISLWPSLRNCFWRVSHVHFLKETPFRSISLGICTVYTNYPKA